MQPFFLFLNVHPQNFLPPVFERCCSYLWGDSQGLITCLYFCFCREATSHFPPLVNTVYLCTSFKMYFFCFSPFLRHILDRFLFPGAVYQVVPVLAVTQCILIKSSWWSIPLCSFSGVERLKSSGCWVLQSWGEFWMDVICRKAFLRVMVNQWYCGFLQVFS